jgi:two-component system NtrC family response regulator
VIVLTGQNDRSNALRAVGLGAYDFFAKPFEVDMLGLTIERAYRLYDLQQENNRLQLMHQPDVLAGLITRDPEVLRVCRTVEKVAASDATVLVLGESGTGKELIARGVHAASPRSKERFVAINCAAIPDNLLESELFGYEKGAFTGAVEDDAGKDRNAASRNPDARRNWRFAAFPAGQAFALPAGTGDRADWRTAGNPDRCAHRLRHASGSQEP